MTSLLHVEMNKKIICLPAQVFRGDGALLDVIDQLFVVRLTWLVHGLVFYAVSIF